MELSWSWTTKSLIQVHKKKENLIVACLRPRWNVKLGILTSKSCSDGKEMYKKSVMHVQRCYFAVMCPHKPVSRIMYTHMMSCHINHNSNSWNTWEKASSLTNYIAALLSPSKKYIIYESFNIPICHTYIHLYISYFKILVTTIK